MSKIILHLYSGDLIIENSHPGIEAELRYSHKTLVEDPHRPGNRIKAFEETQLFTVMEGISPRQVMTYQGFTDRIVRICKKLGLDYDILDHRKPMPNPRMELAKGFRGTQFGMFINLMRPMRSGILKAPTRYGKSSLILNTLRVFPGKKSIVLSPEAGLSRQLVEELQKALPDREVRGIFDGSKGKKESDDITVVSMDSMHKVTHAEVELILVDEPHALASPTRIFEFLKFKNARIYGFGATVSGRFDQADKIIEGMIGPVLVSKTFQEAVQEGMICPIIVYMLKIPFNQFPIKMRSFAYKRLLLENPKIEYLLTKLHNQIPADWQTLIFIQEIKQGEMSRSIPGCEVAAASLLSKEERKKKFDAMAAGTLKRCMATSIYSTGVTFPELRCIINAAGGGGSITGVQKPGRLAQNRPGKVAGYMIDFLFDCVQYPRPENKPPAAKHFGVAEEESLPPAGCSEWGAVVADCHSRLKTYRKLGYDVRIINDISEIQLR